MEAERGRALHDEARRNGQRQVDACRRSKKGWKRNAVPVEQEARLYMCEMVGCNAGEGYMAEGLRSGQSSVINTDA